MGISEGERLKVWVRAGGRCARCKVFLLESQVTAREVPLGELGHNVGRSTSARSPRGEHPLPLDFRDRAENLVLLCSSCHTEIDKLAQVQELSVEKIAELKRLHEAFIRHVTGLDPERRTIVLRVLGRVRGTPIDLRPEVAASAILARSDRYPAFDLAPDRQGIEIDLRQLAGEAAAGSGYYAAATAAIDEALATRLRPAAEKDALPHLSIFALARLPLLIYLGSRIDDTIPTDIYQRHRDDETWRWLSDAGTIEFTHRLGQEGDDSEAVLIVNASGTIHPNEIPSELPRFTRFVVEPSREIPGPDTIRSPSTLRSFERAVRTLLSDIESARKGIKRIHVFAAAPVSAAVTLGRSVGWGIHPTLAVYDRSDGSYIHALEVKS